MGAVIDGSACESSGQDHAARMQLVSAGQALTDLARTLVVRTLSRRSASVQMLIKALVLKTGRR